MDVQLFLQALFAFVWIIGLFYIAAFFKKQREDRDLRLMKVLAIGRYAYQSCAFCMIRDNHKTYLTANEHDASELVCLECETVYTLEPIDPLAPRENGEPIQPARIKSFEIKW